MYLLMNEEDDVCVELDCNEEQLKHLEDELLNTTELKLSFCDHLYFNKSENVFDNCNVIKYNLLQFKKMCEEMIKLY